MVYETKMFEKYKEIFSIILNYLFFKYDAAKKKLNPRNKICAKFTWNYRTALEKKKKL